MRVECDVADYYGCAVERLNRVGEDGWYLLSTVDFPDPNIIYLMERVVTE